MSNTELGSKARTAVYWSVSLKSVQQLYHFVVLVIVARILSPGEFGVMAVSTSIITYLNSLTSFGLTDAIVQRDKIDDDLVNTVFSLNVALSVLLVPLCFFLSPGLATFLNAEEIEEVLPVLSLLIPLSTFYSVPMALLRRELNFKLHSIIDLCQFVIHSTAMLIMALMGFGIWSLVYSSILGYSVAAVLLFLVVKWKPRLTFHKESFSLVYSFGFWELLRFHVNYVEENAANLFISRFLGPVMLGYYERAGSIASIPLKKIQLHINSVTFSVFSRIQYEQGKLEDAFFKTYLMVSFFIIPLLVGMSLVAPYFVINAFGTKWASMIVPMQILSIAGIFRILSDGMGVINVAVNQVRRQAMANALTSLLFLIICFICVKYGIIGMSIGVLLSAVVNFSYCCYITSISLKISVESILKNVMLPVIGAVAMTLTAIIVKYAFGNSFGLKEMFIVIILCMVSYIVTMSVLPNKRIKELFGLIMRDIRLKQQESGIFSNKS